MDDLIGAFKIERYNKDECVCEIKEKGYKFYIIMQGEVSCLIDTTEKRVPKNVMGRQLTYGEHIQ
jgi:hypothetical protein